MGLGKSLQVIAYLHTVLTNSKIHEKVSQVMLVVPKNVLLNWGDEFGKWLSTRGLYDLRIFKLGIKQEGGDRLATRLKVVKEWSNSKGEWRRVLCRIQAVHCSRVGSEPSILVIS